MSEATCARRKEYQPFDDRKIVEHARACFLADLKTPGTHPGKI